MFSADLNTWLPFLNSGGVMGLLFLIIVGGARQWWYYGHVYRDKSVEAAQWRQVAIGSLSTIENLLDQLEPVLQKLADD